MYGWVREEGGLDDPYYQPTNQPFHKNKKRKIYSWLVIFILVILIVYSVSDTIKTKIYYKLTLANAAARCSCGLIDL